MDKKQKKASDFRYDTGKTKVPWAAVGEGLNNPDILEIIKFLIPEGKNGKEYKKQFSKVEEEIENLCKKEVMLRNCLSGRK